MEALKDPKMAKEAARLLKNDGEDRLADLLKDVEVTDDDTIESVSKKHQSKIKELVSYFNDRLDEVKTQAVEESTADTKAAKEKEIHDFEKANPEGMKNPEVIAIMQPLYDKGETLASCYAKACRALELDVKTGLPPSDEGEEDKSKKKSKGDEEAKEKSTKKLSSNKSFLSDDGDEDEDDDDGKKDKPLTLTESLEANANTLLAKPEYEGLFSD